MHKYKLGDLVAIRYTHYDDRYKGDGDAHIIVGMPFTEDAKYSHLYKCYSVMEDSYSLFTVYEIKPYENNDL